MSDWRSEFTKTRDPEEELRKRLEKEKEELLKQISELQRQVREINEDLQKYKTNIDKKTSGLIGPSQSSSRPKNLIFGVPEGKEARLRPEYLNVPSDYVKVYCPECEMLHAIKPGPSATRSNLCSVQLSPQSYAYYSVLIEPIYSDDKTKIIDWHIIDFYYNPRQT
jgi:hypothetical protein